jgi:hypothetical protein
MLIFPTDLQKSSIFNMREGKQSLWESKYSCLPIKLWIINSHNLWLQVQP